MRAARDIVDAMPLDMHAGHENDIRPRKIFRLRAVDVFVDKADFPFLRNQRGDDENSLRRHKAPSRPP